MLSLRKFLKCESGTIAMQAAIMALPLFLLVGGGVDYSRVAMSKKELQSTLDNMRGVPIKDFTWRSELEAYIAGMASANMDSETVQVRVKIRRDYLQVEAFDKIKTPMLSLAGKPEIQIVAKAKIGRQTSSGTVSSNKQPVNPGNPNITKRKKKKTVKVSKLKINKMKKQIRDRINRIWKNPRLSSRQKRKYVNSLRQQLNYLNTL